MAVRGSDSRPDENTKVATATTKSRSGRSCKKSDNRSLSTEDSSCETSAVSSEQEKTRHSRRKDQFHKDSRSSRKSEHRESSKKHVSSRHRSHRNHSKESRSDSESQSSDSECSNYRGNSRHRKTKRHHGDKHRRHRKSAKPSSDRHRHRHRSVSTSSEFSSNETRDKSSESCYDHHKPKSRDDINRSRQSSSQNRPTYYYSKPYLDSNDGRAGSRDGGGDGGRYGGRYGGRDGGGDGGRYGGRDGGRYAGRDGGRDGDRWTPQRSGRPYGASQMRERTDRYDQWDPLHRREGGGMSFRERSPKWGGTQMRNERSFQQRESRYEGNNMSRTLDASMLPPFIKAVYSPDPNRPKLSAEDIASLRQSRNITINDEERCPEPVIQFSEAGFTSAITHLLSENFARPTPIQCQAWPIVLSGLNLIGNAATGSGKSLAFMLPAIMHVKAQNCSRREGPIVLVVAPTRELALQICESSKPYMDSESISHGTVYGGMSMYEQRNMLRSGLQIVVATPGRLLQFINEGAMSLNRISYFVLDEADRLLDMGFRNDLLTLASQLRPDRQTLMWSATWPENVEMLAQQIFTDTSPIHLTVGSQGSHAATTIKHEFYYVKNFSVAIEKLIGLLDGKHTTRTIIFCNQIAICEDVANRLNDALPLSEAQTMHSQKDQRTRNVITQNFRQGTANILVATDVLARGMDFSNVTGIVVFDLPNNVEDWIHRVGRTARASTEGFAYTFCRPHDKPILEKIKSVLKNTESLGGTFPDSFDEAYSECCVNFRPGYGPSVLSNYGSQTWGRGGGSRGVGRGYNYGRGQNDYSRFMGYQSNNTWRGSRGNGGNQYRQPMANQYRNNYESSDTDQWGVRKQTDPEEDGWGNGEFKIDEETVEAPETDYKVAENEQGSQETEWLQDNTPEGVVGEHTGDETEPGPAGEAV